MQVFDYILVTHKSKVPSENKSSYDVNYESECHISPNLIASANEGR